MIDKKTYVQGFLNGVKFKNGYLYSHTKCVCGEMTTVNTNGTISFCPLCKTLRDVHWNGSGWVANFEPVSYEVKP